MSCTHTTYDKEGLPAELIEDGRLLVNADIETQLIKALNGLEASNEFILEQLILLNARFEEAFNTKLDKEDL